MKSYKAFVKKEWIESIRNYKFLILVIIFSILGILSPFSAKILPDLLGTMDINGVKITIPPATAIDSWTQFYNNVTQIGFITLVIIYSGILSNELSKGTLINMLTKGLTRKVIILAKFSITTVVWSISYWLCFSLTYGYTMVYWSMSDLNNVLLAATCVWLFGELLLALILFGGVLAKSNYSSLLFCGLVIVIMMIINIIPNVNQFNPISLVTNNLSLLTNQTTLSDIIINIITTFCLIIGLIIGSINIFNKKEI